MTGYSSGLALKEKGMFAFKLLLLVVLHAADLILTLNLYFHGALEELNPIADLVLDRTGALGLATCKVLLICFVIVVMCIAYPKHKELVRVGLTFCNVVTLVAVVLGCWVNTVYYNNATLGPDHVFMFR